MLTITRACERRVWEILDPEEGVLYLPKLMRQYLLQEITGRPLTWLHHYYSKRLALLETAVAPLMEASPIHGHLEFRTIAAELAGARTLGAIAGKLGIALRGEDDCYSWEEWANQALRHGDNAVALYCMVNGWAVLDFRSDLPGPSLYREALGIWAEKGFRGPFPVIGLAEMDAIEAPRRAAIVYQLACVGHVVLAKNALWGGGPMGDPGASCEP